MQRLAEFEGVKKSRALALARMSIAGHVSVHTEALFLRNVTHM